MPPEILLVLIPAGSAIVASVLAQIIGGAISANQAKKRLDWEKEQAELNRYADLRWHLFGDVMTQLLIIDREVDLCEERAIIQESWDAKQYFAAVENLQTLIGRTRLIDATVAELLNFLLLRTVGAIPLTDLAGHRGAVQLGMRHVLRRARDVVQARSGNHDGPDGFMPAAGRPGS